MADHDYLWDPSSPTDPEVERLEALLGRYRLDARTAADAPRPAAARPPARAVSSGAPAVRWALAASLALAAVLGAREVSRRQLRPWQVSALAGAPRVGAAGAGRALEPGGWVETDAASRARLNVGSIGKAVIGPGSRVRLVRAAGTEHRLALDRGMIHARIWAPPRFFLVETPSALAIDLGCVYTLRVDAEGAGVLAVQSGEVELARGGRTTLVPAGNVAALRPGAGPGLPSPETAGEGYRALVAAVDAGATDGAVAALAAASDRRHSITLWHLIPRVEGARRALVVDRLAALAPPPPGVRRDLLLAADPRALAAWREHLAPGWSAEEVPGWKRAWRGISRWVTAQGARQ